MKKLLQNSYRFTSANSARIENGNGTNNTGALTSDGRYGFDCSGFVAYLLKNGGYILGSTPTATRLTINSDGTLKPDGAKWQKTIQSG